MQITNAFFRKTDRRANVVAGMSLPPYWWSRPYEYAFALDHAAPGQVAADMGTGWFYRPLRDALADVCDAVYAVDIDERLLDQKKPDNMVFIVADFTKAVTDIPPASLDRIFCVSVLEDLGDALGGALAEFARLLKNDGLVVATFDVQYDDSKPLGTYPGVDFRTFEHALECAGLGYVGSVDMSKRDVVYSEEFNLCCFHALLRRS